MEHPIVINSSGKMGSYTAWKSHPSFRASLAASMALPIRRSLDYHGIARRALMVDPMPEGALPTYDRDIDFDAIKTSIENEKVTKLEHDEIVIGPNGKIGRKGKGFGRRVVVPTFEVFNNPTIKISEVKRRRFNLIDRAVQKARQEIMAQEDEAIFKALDAAGNKEE